MFLKSQLMGMICMLSNGRLCERIVTDTSVLISFPIRLYFFCTESSKTMFPYIEVVTIEERGRLDIGILTADNSIFNNV